MLYALGLRLLKQEVREHKKQKPPFKIIFYSPFNQAAVCRHFLYNKTIGVQHIIEGCADTVSNLCQSFPITPQIWKSAFVLLFPLIKHDEMLIRKNLNSSKPPLSFHSSKIWFMTQTQFVYALCLFSWSEIEWTTL